MFKLVVLSALVAIAAAKPGHLAAPVAYAAPAVTTYAHAGPAVVSSVAIPAAVSHQSRTDVISKPVVAAYAAPVAAYAAPVATYAAPVVQKAVIAAAPVVQRAVLPAAVSHQSRTDVISKPVVAAYAAPAVAYAAPAVSYAAAPVAYAAPAVHAHSYAAPAIHAGAYAAPALHAGAYAAPALHSYAGAYAAPALGAW